MNFVKKYLIDLKSLLECVSLIVTTRKIKHTFYSSVLGRSIQRYSNKLQN